MKVLVTGGKGVVGRPVVRRLVRHGFHVKVIDRKPGADVEGAEYVECDVNDFEAVREQVRGQDAIIHLAAIPFPGGAAGHEIFRINCAGTYNVYEAAAVEGIHRVVTASSINALGFYYGVRESDIHYFPIDEDHPTFTTDPYSFSKQVTEAIADYYWRREGISGVCLRLPGVWDSSEVTRARFKDWLPRTKKMLEDLISLPEKEKEEQMGRLKAFSDDFRTHRWLEFSADDRQKQGFDMHHVEYRLFSGRANFWARIDGEDSAQAFEKGILAEYEGSHALFVNDPVNSAGFESERLLKLFFPSVTARSHPLFGIESLVSIEKARRLIGFEPEFSLESYFNN